MNIKEASRWRIELAEEISKLYTCKIDVVMSVIGGSPSRGLSDAYSDIDLIIYWEKLDAEFIIQSPLKYRAGNPLLLMDHREHGSMMELYKLDTLIVEVGHVSMESWSGMVDQVMNDYDINPGLQKSLSGFLDSYVIYGKKPAEKWKNKIKQYPEELAKKLIQRNLGFIWRGCIEHQGLDRGEIVFFYDAICQTVKRLMALISGINRRYYALQEPRWIEYELSRMPVKPENMWNRVRNLFDMNAYEAVSELYVLISETVHLVRREFPDLDYSTFDKCSKIRIESTISKPQI